MTRELAIAVLALCCATAEGAGIQAERVLTEPESCGDYVEIGSWSQDERGRTRYNFDEWTHIIDPVARVDWRANPKRKYFSAHQLSLEDARNAAEQLKPTDWRFRSGFTKTDLGTREINGVTCKGSLYEFDQWGGRLALQLHWEEWFTDDFGFPLRVKSVIYEADQGHMRTYELRNIVPLKDEEWEQHFRPGKDWKEVDGEVVRMNTASLGFFQRKGKRGATTRIVRRKDRKILSNDPYENILKPAP